MDPLSAFSPATRAWFEQAFAEPTPAQTLGWPAIASGEHTLIQAPTGSGKTLAAFLYGIDKLTQEGSGFGEMKIKALGSVLAKRYGVAAAQGLVPSHPTLGDVDSHEALERYQAAKRAHKAKLKAQRA